MLLQLSIDTDFVLQPFFHSSHLFSTTKTMVKLLLSIWISIYFMAGSSFASSSYLVSLHSQETIDTFMAYDATYPQDLQVGELINSKFKIGNFSGFSGSFSKDIIKRLERCPLVDEIVPDITVKAYDAVFQDLALDTWQE